MDEAPKMKVSTKALIGVAAALAAIPQLRDLKDFILGDQKVTNERLEKTMNESFARLEQKITKHVDDDIVVHRRLRDLDREDIQLAEARCEKRSDKVDERISNLEVYAFKLTGTRKRSNEGG